MSDHLLSVDVEDEVDVKVQDGFHDLLSAGVKVQDGSHDLLSAGVKVQDGSHDLLSAGVKVQDGPHDLLSAGVKVKDEFDIFGEYIACQLRNLQTKMDRATAKNRINNVLHQLEVSGLKESSNKRSTPMSEDGSRSARGGAKMDNPEDLKGFNLIFIITEVIGILLVILVAIWTGKYQGGFTWSSNPSLQFNWHPLLMTIGMVYFFANSILIYRSLRTLRKKQLKLIHAGIHFTILILVIIAQIAVIDSHNLATPPIPNFYSIHSWVGLATVTVFVLQYVFGFAAFLFPGFPVSLRAAIMPIHVYMGLTAFVMACATCLMGLNEKAIFSVKGYSSFPAEGILVNFIGLFIIVFGGFVVYLATNHHYKRYPRPEDGGLLVGGSE